MQALKFNITRNFNNFNTKIITILFLTTISLSSCVIKGGPGPNDIIDPIDEKPWEKLPVDIDNTILDLHATPFELFALTDNQFLRFKNDGSLLEKRILSIDRPHYGRPVMSDNTFMRLIRNEKNHHELEFHACKNPTQIIRIPVDSLMSDGESTMLVDFEARQPGCYSADGVYYFLPVATYPSNTFKFIIFKIQMNPQTTAIEDISVYRKIQVPGLVTDFNPIMASRFIGGNFYCATKTGAYKIALNGNIQKFSEKWMIDFFPYANKIYCTSTDATDFLVSVDNGINWQSVGYVSNLRFIESCGNKLFYQNQRGLPYQLVNDDFSNYKNIKYSTELVDCQNCFYDIVYFNGKYYISRNKEMYSNAEIVTE